MKVRVRVEPPKAVTVSVVVLVRHADNVRIGPKTITENGTFYPANESLDGYSPVVVDVNAQPKLQDKTVDPAIVPVKVKADPPNDGLGEVTVNAMPVIEQVTPQITVDEETGVVTARASQPSGYVVGGTKENSKQLETKGAQIYTPGDEENIIPAGVFLTGKQTFAKVPTQEATITENGEHIPPSGRYYSKVVVAVPESGGTDTDDANATQSDMAAGTSGYVKGEKVEGILPVKAAGSTETAIGEGLAIEGGKLKMTTTAPADAIHRAGAKTEVRTNADALGIATPDMVLEDATFTSKDGIGQEGTIPRNGDTSATIDGIETKSVDIPAGYTTGGTVALDGTIDNAVEAAKTSLANKGVDVPTDTDVRGLAELIDSIPETGSGGGGDSIPTVETSVESDGETVAKVTMDMRIGLAVTADKYTEEYAVFEATGTALTGDIYANPGDWILVTVTTRSAATFPEGWTVLRESTVLNSNASNQRMAFLCKQVTEEGQVDITITQAESARIYINLLAFSDIQGFAYHEGTEVYGDTTQVNSFTVTRPAYDTIVWGCSSVYWSGSDEWICDGLKVYANTRQANFVDADSTVAHRTFVSGTANTFHIIDCVEVLK